MKKPKKSEIDALKAQVSSKAGKKLLKSNDITIKEDKELIDYTRLIKNLDTKSISYIGIKPIPIKNIIGSVDRYTDFNSKFLTAKDAKSAKYLSVLNATKNGKEMPPIKVYQVVDNYFVIDGHHRVTVAKNIFKTEFIDAEITKVEFELKLESGKEYTYNSETAKKFLILLEEKSFEEKTHLKNNILKYPIKVTNLTSFAKLYEEILSFKKYHDKGEGVGEIKRGYTTTEFFDDLKKSDTKQKLNKIKHILKMYSKRNDGKVPVIDRFEGVLDTGGRGSGR